jgi:hypothetical protein
MTTVGKQKSQCSIVQNIYFKQIYIKKPITLLTEWKQKYHLTLTWINRVYVYMFEQIRAVWSGSMLVAISYRVWKRTAWILIWLRGGAGWSVSMLVANPLCWFCHDAAQIKVKLCFMESTLSYDRYKTIYIMTSACGNVVPRSIKHYIFHWNVIKIAT